MLRWRARATSCFLQLDAARVGFRKFGAGHDRQADAGVGRVVQGVDGRFARDSDDGEIEFGSKVAQGRLGHGGDPVHFL
jgi:hypothetical protein